MGCVNNQGRTWNLRVYRLLVALFVPNHERHLVLWLRRGGDHCGKQIARQRDFQSGRCLHLRQWTWNGKSETRNDFSFLCCWVWVAFAWDFYWIFRDFSLFGYLTNFACMTNISIYEPFAFLSSFLLSSSSSCPNLEAESEASSINFMTRNRGGNVVARFTALVRGPATNPRPRPGNIYSPRQQMR